MAGVTLGFLKYVLGFDSLSFSKGIDKADADLKRMQRNFAKTGDSIATAGKALTAAVTLPLAGFAAAGIREAQETAAAMAQVTSALASTGGAAGRTADQLAEAANAFETRSLFEADQVLAQVTARLLAFGNISGETFDKAQQAIIDYAARTGKDLGAATVLIGKALNDPAKAMGVLGKAGVQLTADQQTLIAQLTATGNVAAAQGILIDALAQKFGGAAQAAQNADPYNKLQDALKGVAEQIGTALIPIIPVLADALTSISQAFQSLTPETQKWVVVGLAAAAALGPLLIGFGALVTTISAAPAIVSGLVTAFGALSGAFTTLVTVAATVGRVLIAGLFANPWILGAAAVVGGIYLAWKNWDKIVAIVRNVYVGVKTYLQDKLAAVFEWVKGKLTGVGDAFYQLYDRVVGHSYVPDMVEEVGQWFAKLNPLMAGTTERVANKTAATFQSMRDRVGGLLRELFPEIQQMAEMAEKAATLRSAETSGLITPEMGQEARRRVYGVEAAKPVDLGSSEAIDDFKVELDDVLPSLRGLGDGAKKLKLDWEEAGYALLNAVGQLFGNSKGGRILGAVLQGGLDLARAFGAFKGARALGGPVLGRRSYLVGERGPEIFTPSSSGRIIANDRIGGIGGARIQVVPSPYFNVVVDNRAAGVAGPISQQAATVAAASGMSATRRQQGRRIP